MDADAMLSSSFETHRSALRLWEQLHSHSAAMLLSMRARDEAPTCGCGKRSPAPFACFRIVIYNGWRNSNVSSGRLCSAAHRWAVSNGARIEGWLGAREEAGGREV